jgi:hypothetical protein
VDLFFKKISEKTAASVTRIPPNFAGRYRADKRYKLLNLVKDSINDTLKEGEDPNIGNLSFWF